MQITTQQLMRNWEKIAYWCVSALFLVVLLAWLGGLGAYQLRPAMARDMPPPATLLNPHTAFAFTEEIPPVTLKTPSPFSHKAQGRPKPRPPEPPPTAPPTTPPPTATAAGTKTAEPAKPAPPPKPVVPKRRLEYLGIMKAASGKELALLRDADSGGTRFVSPADIMFGFKVKSYTGKALVLRDPAGNDVTIDFGQQKEFVVPE